MIRVGISPLVILINNSGYVIEEEIHSGPYNKISDWNYTAVVEGMAGSRKNLYTAKVHLPLHALTFPGCVMLGFAAPSVQVSSSSQHQHSAMIVQGVCMTAHVCLSR